MESATHTAIVPSVTPAAPELGRRLEAGSGLLQVEHLCVLYEYMKYINGDEIACILWQIFPEVFSFVHTFERLLGSFIILNSFAKLNTYTR